MRAAKLIPHRGGKPAQRSPRRNATARRREIIPPDLVTAACIYEILCKDSSGGILSMNSVLVLAFGPVQIIFFIILGLFLASVVYIIIDDRKNKKLKAEAKAQGKPVQQIKKSKKKKKK